MQERRQLKTQGIRVSSSSYQRPMVKQQIHIPKKKQLNVSFNGNAGALIDKAIKWRRCCQA